MTWPPPGVLPVLVRGSLTVVVILKLVGGLRVGGRQLRRWLNAYSSRRAARLAAEELDLRRRVRMDLGAARQVRKQLTRQLDAWVSFRQIAPHGVKADPRFVPMMDRLEQRTRSQLAELEETVQRVHGGWERSLTGG